jgi:ABC-2 type transport system ATP-binding protein
MHGVTASASVALSVQGLSHSYGARKALEDVTFSLAPSSFTVLLGLNGAGKSTLFALLTRLFAAQSGKIHIFGHDLAHTPGEALRLLGVVFQSRTLDLDLSVMQNLLYHAALHGLRRREARSGAEAALAEIGLSDRATEKVRTLSGGQMRRLEIARALLHRPSLLVLDEPTAGLDIKSRADILGRVHRLVLGGVCVLWATHLVDEVFDDDRVIVLHHGRILAHGAVPRLLTDTKTANIRAAFTCLTQTTEPDTSGEAA